MTAYNNRGERRDRNRRRRWLDTVHKSVVSHGCRSWLLGLSIRSDDAAKPVYGMQTKQAKEIRCTDRTVRRYRQEAETAKLIVTDRAESVQDMHGKWRRPRSNVYVFCVPPPTTSRQKPNKNRADSRVRINSTLKSAYKTIEANYAYPSRYEPMKDEPDPYSVRPPMGFDALRACLG